MGRLRASIFSTATSLAVSLPRTRAVNSRRSVSLTVTSLASFTTCALVSTMPFGSTMNPEPSPRIGTSRGWRGKLRKNCRNGSSGPKPGKSGTCGPPAVLIVPVTLMLTTAGPNRSTSAVKSGRVPRTNGCVDGLSVCAAAVVGGALGNAPAVALPPFTAVQPPTSRIAPTMPPSRPPMTHGMGRRGGRLSTSTFMYSSSLRNHRAVAAPE